jgi:hypothetical protein
MIQAAQSAFGIAVVGIRPGHIQSTIVTATRVRG